MTRAERAIATCLVLIAFTAAVVMSGHVPAAARPVVLGWLAILAVSTYGAYLVSALDAGRAHSKGSTDVD